MENRIFSCGCRFRVRTIAGTVREVRQSNLDRVLALGKYQDLFTYRTEVNSHLISMMKVTQSKLEKVKSSKAIVADEEDRSLRNRITCLENPKKYFASNTMPFLLGTDERNVLERMYRSYIDSASKETDFKALATFVFWCGGESVLQGFLEAWMEFPKPHEFYVTRLKSMTGCCALYCINYRHVPTGKLPPIFNRIADLMKRSSG